MTDRLAPGDMIAGKFRVERTIGSGGMGAVLEATDTVLNRRVALKIAHKKLLDDKSSVARFLREARAMAALQGSGFVRVFEVGTLQDDVPFLVMELLRGEDLRERLQRGGPMELDDVAVFIAQTCEALAEAHAIGLVHRDLKPSNLFVEKRRDGREAIRVLDFGISKPADSHDDALTESSGTLGSPRYMSPEQALDPGDVESPTDVWALGVTLYELWTGKPPFDGTSHLRLCKAILEKDPVPPSELREGTPAELEEAILRCLRKKPEERWSVEALAMALAAIVPKAQVHAELAGALSSRRSLAPAVPPTPSKPTPKLVAGTATAIDQTAPATERSTPTGPPMGRRARLVIGGLVVAGLLASAAGLFVTLSDENAGKVAAARAPATLDQASARTIVHAAVPLRDSAIHAAEQPSQAPRAKPRPPDDPLSSSH